MFCAVDKTNEYTEKPSRYECSFENILCKKELVLLVLVALRTLFGLEKASFE